MLTRSAKRNADIGLAATVAPLPKKKKKDPNSIVSVVMSESNSESYSMSGIDIRSAIREFLPADDMHSTSRVNRAWRETVLSHSRRRNLHPLIQTPSTAHIMGTVDLLKMGFRFGYKVASRSDLIWSHINCDLFDVPLEQPLPKSSLEAAAFVGNMDVMKHLSTMKMQKKMQMNKRKRTMEINWREETYVCAFAAAGVI
jgi:hypothetical protein